MKFNSTYVRNICAIAVGVVIALVPAKNVKASDTEAVLAAQQAAIAAEQYAREQQAAAQAQSDMALALAQQKALSDEAASSYAQWGEVPESLKPYLNGGNGNVIMPGTTGLAPTVGSTIINTTPKAVVPGGKVVDLIIFAGQSNMSGAGGNAALAPAVANGCGYEFRAVSDPSGLYPITEPFGIRENGYIGENAACKLGSLVSSFVNTYYQSTGVPVVAVSASRGATDTNYWCSPSVRSDLLGRFTKAKSYLAANNITVRKKYLVWLQGESDAVSGTTPLQYRNNMNTAFASLFLGGLDQVFVITPGGMKNGLYPYDSIINAQRELCASSSRFTLASSMLRTLPTTYMSDEVHYNQQALNMVGADAARRAAAFSK